MCDSPYMKKLNGYLMDVALPCGKCPICKRRRVNDWAFRLEQEEKVSSSSHFITLTYANQNLNITKNKFSTLSKRDCQLFMKRLRKLSKNKLRYYLAGEYGDITARPHYHLILFNLEDETYINEAWGLGQVHIGQVTGKSMAYTCKYIDKQKRIPLHQNDDRQREFSLMSRGLGENYLTQKNINWHKADPSRNYIQKEGGYKIALPRYYRERIYDPLEKSVQRQLIAQKNQENYDNLVIKSKKLGEGFTPESMIDSAKKARYNRFYSSSQKIRK
ncbi:replication initiator protein [Microviridae sp.]|nr:replication initiator protein [Microviridae sp.]